MKELGADDYLLKFIVVVFSFHSVIPDLFAVIPRLHSKLWDPAHRSVQLDRSLQVP